MSTKEIVAELLAEQHGTLSEQEYAMLYANELSEEDN